MEKCVIYQILDSTPKPVAVTWNTTTSEDHTDWQRLGDWEENGLSPNLTARRPFPPHHTLGKLQRGCVWGGTQAVCLWVVEVQDMTCANLCLRVVHGGPQRTLI